MSNHSVDSSLSSEDQFDSLRTSADLHPSKSGEVEVSLKATPHPATAKTPGIKTPSMEALTRKWQFLLAKDEGGSDDNLEDDNDAYFRTPPPAFKLERVQSLGSRRSLGSQNSRGSRRSVRSNSTPPTSIVKPSLSAQKILHRLHTPEGSGKGPPRVPPSSRSWDVSVEHQVRQRSTVKQNLEERLRQLEDQHSISSAGKQQQHTPPRWQSHYRTRAQSPFGSTEERSRLQGRQQSEQQQQQAPSSPRFVTSSTTTATTMALSDATMLQAGVHSSSKLQTDSEQRDGDPKDSTDNEQEQHMADSHSKERQGAAFVRGTGKSNNSTSNNNEADNASFWHRWKTAEKKMRQQQEQFEQEKKSWMKQLEKAEWTTAQVDALRKRMEVQLMAVHRTCLPGDGGEEGLLEQYSQEDGPIDPLHLLMLKDSGSVPPSEIEKAETLSSAPSYSDEMDSSEYTDRLEQRMARTKTKNVILSHLVKLLERQSDEQKNHLERQLKAEREERTKVVKDLEKLQDQALGKSGGNAPPDTENKPSSFSSPVPTEKDHTKALQHRLWLREQQYEQERKEFDAKIRALQAECDHYKQQAEARENTSSQPRATDASPDTLKEKLESVTKELEIVQSESNGLRSQYESLQTQCKELQQTLDNNERAQKRKDLKQMQELQRVENQLSRAKDELKSLRQVEEKAMSLEAKIERMETKHGREKKELEWRLNSKGSMAPAKTTKSDSEWTRKQHERERSSWESQLNAAKMEATRCRRELEDCKEATAQAFAEKDGLLLQMEAAESEVGHYQQELSDYKESTSHALTEKQNVLSDVQEQMKAARAEAIHYQQELDACTEEKASLQEQLQMTKSEANRFEQDLNDCIESKAQILKELQEQREKTEHLERDSRNKNLEPIGQELKNKHEFDVQELMQRLERMKGDCEAKEKRISDLQTWLEESNAEVAKLQVRVDDNKKTKQAYDEQNFTRQLEEEITNLEFSLQVERENLEEAQAENAKLLGAIEELKNEADEGTSAPDGNGQQSRSLVSVIEDSVDYARIVEKHKDLERQMQEVTSELAQCQDKCQNLMETNIGLEFEIEELNRKHEDEKRKWGQHTVVEADESSSFGSQSGIKQIVPRDVSELELKLRQTTSELNAALESSHEAEERNSALQRDLQKLNERFIAEMKEMEARYQGWLSESNDTKTNLLEKNADLESLLSESNRVQTDLQEKNATLEQQIQELQAELEIEDSKQSQLEERNSTLQTELLQLNDRFIGEMKEMDLRYQSLVRDSNIAHGQNQGQHADLVIHVKELETQLQSQCEQLQVERAKQEDYFKEIETLKNKLRAASEMRANENYLPKTDGESQRLLDETLMPRNHPQEFHKEEASTVVSSPCSMGPSLQWEDNALLQAKLTILQNELNASIEKNKQYERELNEINDVHTKEREDWQSQMQNLPTCGSTDSVRTQELIQQKEERERQLDEAKRELEAGLKALGAESEKYRSVVQSNAQLRLDNEKLVHNHQSATAELQRLQDVFSTEKKAMQQQMQDLRNGNEQALQELRHVSDEKNAELARIQRRQDELLSDKQELQCQLAATEQQIQTLRECHEAQKRDWREAAKLVATQTGDSCTSAVRELKDEVMKMGEEIVISNQTIKELRTSRASEEDLLPMFDKIQQTILETATKIAEDAKSMAAHGNRVPPTADFENFATSVSTLKDAVISQHKSLQEEIQNLKNPDDAFVVRRELASKLHQCEADLALAKIELENVSTDLQNEKNTREAAEAEVSTLNSKLLRSEREAMNFPMQEIQFKGQSRETIDNPIEDTCDVGDLDGKLAELSAAIDEEMNQIRCLCVIDENHTGVVDDHEELFGARQAMLAQTVLLVQSLRDLLVNEDSSQEEDKSASALQHLEILSEFIGEVDLMEERAAEDKVNSTGPRDLIVREDEGIETDLLQFELAQDDSMCDLRPDANNSDFICSPVHDVNIIPLGSDHAFDEERAETASPIQLVVEQTYNRCQALERERCDLINTTLDLLSASREANKAEIDAALASARRKASEEMIAMKQQTQACIDQVWSRLCDKCRQGLVQD